MGFFRLTAATLEEAIESVDSPLGPDDPRDEEYCDESCSKFVEGGPACKCYSGEGEIWRPGC